MRIYRFLILAGFLIYAGSGAAQLLSPDDSISGKQWSVIPVPMVFYTPATDWAFGPALFIRSSLQDSCASCNASFTRLYGYYTLSKQWFARLDGELWWGGDDFKFRYDVNYSVTPFRFYGIGNETPASQREPFAQDRILMRLELSRRLLSDRQMYAGVLIDWQSWQDMKVATGGLLDTANITGQHGGRSLGWGILLNYDTRDHIYYPRNGWYTDVLWSWYNALWGSDFNFAVLQWDVRKFWPVAKRQAIGWQLYSQVTAGEVPFQRLASLGSENWLRGIVRGRLLDKVSLSTQVAFRTPLFWRFGLNIFAGVGRVGETLTDLTRLSGYHVAYGLGGRFTFDRSENINARFDIAYSPLDGLNYYFTIREAF